MSKATDWRLMSDVDAAAAERFADLDSVFALDGEIVALDSMTRTLRVEINGRGYYVKRYAGLGKKPLRRWFATPRVQLEWENLGHFADWGIPTARLVGYGLQSQGGRFQRGALITAEIADTTDLGALARNGDPRLKSRRWLDGVSRQLADIARRMHSRRFVHGDFKWRNLLVDKANTLHLIDCPSGGFWWPPFLEYRIVKDLACLDKVAKLHLSRTRRLRFYLDYAQKKTLAADDKRRLRKIAGFFTGRDDLVATAASLRAAGRNPLPQISIALEDGSLVAIHAWQRILPGKRLTGHGEWQGRKVLAKLFIAERGSERHWQRECSGAENLKRHGLPTPAVLASGLLGDGGHYVLYDYLDGAHTPDSARLDELMPVFAQVGRMHAKGLVQEDAHLGNFLLKDGGLYVIDGDAIRGSAAPADCAANLALLLAQLQPQAEEALRTALLAAYAGGNFGGDTGGNPDVAIDEAQLAAATMRAREARLADYLAKSLRDCSLFKSANRVDRFFSNVRSETALLAPLIHDPDAWLEKGIPLKRGRTATLARVEVNGRQLVIKRYNIKGTVHALSRSWRPSRAWHSWLEGHRLNFLGIATPRPLALVEQRAGPLRGKAWLITEYCDGESLAERYPDPDTAPPAAELDAIGALLGQLVAARISHGDLKATNLLWCDGKPHLIDLDAMRQHASAAVFRRAWEKDSARFLRNWPEGSTLRRALEAVLPQA
jgi:tRNA A-37 threonylcarbamoyl transferase component Bud32